MADPFPLPDVRFTARVWSVVLPAASVEPVAQFVLGSGLLRFVVPLVFLIGVVEMLLLRRFGYLPMLAATPPGRTPIIPEHRTAHPRGPQPWALSGMSYA